MTKEQEDLIWSCIEPADNRLTPGNSDGYNEGEVYATCCRLLSTKEYLEVQKDADNWRNYQEECKSLN